MIKIPFLHYSKDKKSLIKSYYTALIPLVLFSLYKNGILLYQHKYISFLDIFVPLYFYFISIVIGIIVAHINKFNKKEFILYSLILSCSISINTNMIIYPIGLFASLFITSYLKRKKEFNMLALVRLFLGLILLLNSYSYLNISEKINAFNYSYFDLFLGFNTSGIATSSLFLILISFIILSFNKFYKKYIALSASASFLFLSLMIFFISHNPLYLNNLINGSVYYGFIFVASDLFTTPNNKTGMIVYGFLIGVLSAMLSLFIPIYEVSYISILLISLFILKINNQTNKKYLQF